MTTRDVAASRRPEPVPSDTLQDPCLSVVIVSYRCRELLAACVASLAGERSLLPLEVIVVDNDSRDGTMDMLHDKFPWVRAVDSAANLGFSRANNLALAMTTGEFVLLLNPDTVVPHGALAATVEALMARPDVGMLGCRLVKPDGTLDHACKRGFPTPFSAISHFVGLGRLKPGDQRFASYTAAHLGEYAEGTVDAINGAFMLVRRPALESVGPLDEDFWMYGEDLDWCLRFWQAGWPVLYWPGVTVEHRKGGSSGAVRSWKTNLEFHRSMSIFYRKHYSKEHPTLVNAAVHAAIWSKLGISALRSMYQRTVAA